MSKASVLPHAQTVLAADDASPMESTCRGPDGSSCHEPAVTTTAEDRSNRYQLIAEIGAGAMGVVYRAHDRILARDVALKLMKSTAPLAGIRGVREAQALAKVSHPNVVRVYDADALDEGVMLVMEYIEGESLVAWLKRSHSWERRLEVLIHAGMGLAAVHDAGLIHCDFKPGNVLISDSGEVKVADFGLARPSEPRTLHDQAGRSSSMAHASLVDSGTAAFVGGTPAYMSPEQHFGGDVGAHSDQYSFAATLYESLYGDWPFPADDLIELRRKIQIGTIAPPPPDSKVPRRIYKIILRGLAYEAHARWPSMEAMLAALRRDPARTRRRVLGLSGVVLAASMMSYGLAVSSSIEPCGGIEAALDGVWDASRKSAVHDTFAASGAPFADDAWGRIEARLDTYATTWIGHRRNACEDQASGVLSERLAERQLTCMERRKVQLGTLVDILTTADSEVIENSVQAVAGLPDLRACTDVNRYMAETLLPGDSEAAIAVTNGRELLARSAILESAGLYDEAMTSARSVRNEARDLGFAPLRAEARLRVGSVLLAQGRAQEASKVLELALTTALENDLHVIAAEAGAKWVFALGHGEHRYEAALTGATIVEAIVKRAQDWRLTALFNNNVGSVLTNRGELAPAIKRFEVTLKIIKERGKTSDPLFAVTLHNLGELHLKHNNLDAAEHHYREAVSTMRESLGPSHPMRAHPLAGLGDIALRRGELEIAETHFWRALTLMEEAYGAQSLYIVQPLVGLAQIAMRRSQPDAALTHFTRVVSTCDALHVEIEYLANALVGLGEIAALVPDPAVARGHFERALSVFETIDADPVALATASLRAGEMAAAAGNIPAALPHFTRVLNLSSSGAAQRQLAALALTTQLELLVDDALPDEQGHQGACERISQIELSGASAATRAKVASLRDLACATPP